MRLRLSEGTCRRCAHDRLLIVPCGADTYFTCPRCGEQWKKTAIRMGKGIAVWHGSSPNVHAVPNAVRIPPRHVIE